MSNLLLNLEKDAMRISKRKVVSPPGIWQGRGGEHKLSAMVNADLKHLLRRAAPPP